MATASVSQTTIKSKQMKKVQQATDEDAAATANKEIMKVVDHTGLIGGR